MKKSTKLLSLALCGYFFLKGALLLSLWVCPLPRKFLEEDYSQVHLDSEQRLLRLSLSPAQQYRVKLPLSQISDDLQRGFILYEDKYFYFHPGFNPVAIGRSLISNARSGRVVMGASTITMQIAKMMEPKRRTLGGKLFELFRALQLETRYSKKQLLDIYLNSVPMGGNIQGVGAASYLYFGKAANALSFGEAAMLIALPRSPNRYRPDRRSPQTRRQKIKIMRLIGEEMNMTPSEFRDYSTRLLPAKRQRNPFSYPHLLIRTQSLTNDKIKRLTIDPHIQATCEDMLAKAISHLKEEGTFNGAVMVIDNHSMKVLGYVGSPDFHDTQHNGQMNGANIARSPGSLFKPFLYSIAFEKGMLTPRMLVYDIERNYDGYIPANFDRTFHGPVSAEDALINSLNVPAVNLEYELGADGLPAFIRKCRMERASRNLSKMGLSLVLGAHPMTLEEMVRLYSIFSNQGRLRQLQFFQSDDRVENKGIQIFSPETCYLMAQMLTKLERPDLPQSWEFTTNRGRIAFKTGTSFGLRDAWCIGFNPDYTVGVWLGNVDAKSSSALVGIKAAAPVVVNIFNELTRYSDSWFRKPKGVGTRAVCALSGEPAGPNCSARMSDEYIPGVSRADVCRVHRKIWIRKKDGVEVCSACMNGPRSDYAERVVEVWPPDVASFLRRSGKPVNEPPVHNPACQAAKADQSLKVRSPMAGGFYALTDALTRQKQKIPLVVQSRRGTDTVYWFLNDTLIGRGSPDQTFYIDPIPGENRVTVMNSWGAFDTVRFVVRRRL